MVAKREKLISSILENYVAVEENGVELPCDQWNDGQRAAARRAAELYLDYAAGLPGIMHGIARPMTIVAHPGWHISHNGFPIEFEDTEDGIRMHVSMRAEGLEGHVQRALTARFKKVEETELKEHPNRISAKDAIIPGRRESSEGFSNTSSGFHYPLRRVGPYDVLAGPDHGRLRKNTWGHLNDSKQLLPEEIAFEQKLLFTKEHMDKQSPGDWLRSLRVLAGISTPEMARMIGMTQRNYSGCENQRLTRLPLKRALIIFEKNILKLPMVDMHHSDGTQETIIDPAYAVKFLTKMGMNPAAYPNPTRVIEMATAEVLEAFKRGEIQPDELPMMGEVIRYLSYAQGKWLGEKHQLMVCKNQHALKDNIPELANLLGISENSPVFSLPTGHIKFAFRLPDTTLCSVAKTHAQGHAGTFLRHYREWRGKALGDITEKMGITQERVRQNEEKDFLTPKLYEKLITLNPYEFPVDAHGKITQEVQNTLKSLLKPPPMRNRYRTKGYDLTHGIPAVLEWVGIDEILSRVIRAKETRQFSKFWAGLEQEVMNTGHCLDYRGRELRAKIEDGQLFIHSDSLPYLLADHRITRFVLPRRLFKPAEKNTPSSRSR